MNGSPDIRDIFKDLPPMDRPCGGYAPKTKRVFKTLAIPRKDAQRKTLVALCNYIEENTQRPTKKELCRALGYSDPTSANSHLAFLKGDGFVTVEKRVNRGISVTEKGWEAWEVLRHE